MDKEMKVSIKIILFLHAAAGHIIDDVSDYCCSD